MDRYQLPLHHHERNDTRYALSFCQLDKFMDAWKDPDYRALVTEPATEPMCLLESDEANMRAS